MEVLTVQQKRNEYQKRYYHKNKERLQEYNRERFNKKYDTNAQFREKKKQANLEYQKARVDKPKIYNYERKTVDCSVCHLARIKKSKIDENETPVCKYCLNKQA